MNKNDYTSIRNLQQLHQARAELKLKVEIKEYELTNNISACKEALNPITYINRLITKLYTMEYFTKYFLKGYEFVKELFNRNQEQDISQQETPEQQA